VELEDGGGSDAAELEDGSGFGSGQSLPVRHSTGSTEEDDGNGGVSPELLEPSEGLSSAGLSCS
jgi:hypothetical protein